MHMRVQNKERISKQEETVVVAVLKCFRHSRVHHIGYGDGVAAITACTDSPMIATI